MPNLNYEINGLCRKGHISEEDTKRIIDALNKLAINKANEILNEVRSGAINDFLSLFSKEILKCDIHNVWGENCLRGTCRSAIENYYVKLGDVIECSSKCAERTRKLTEDKERKRNENR